MYSRCMHYNCVGRSNLDRGGHQQGAFWANGGVGRCPGPSGLPSTQSSSQRDAWIRQAHSSQGSAAPIREWGHSVPRHQDLPGVEGQRGGSWVGHPAPGPHLWSGLSAEGSAGCLAPAVWNHGPVLQAGQSDVGLYLLPARAACASWGKAQLWAVFHSLRGQDAESGWEWEEEDGGQASSA